jgi:putative DNA primase/helicase
VKTNGTLDEWIQNVGKLAQGNSRLVLAISAAFATLLLKPCKRENFGIHFVGGSSEGKTTALYVAASVFGSRQYLKPWRSTDNGLELVAAAHSDMLLVLDEIGQMDSRKLGDTVYMLANGSGKIRSTASCEMRRVATWHIGTLSTGEVDLETHMAEANKKMMAGQAIRLLSIPAKPALENSGLLEKLHGFNSYNELAQYLKEATEKYFGAPMKAFVEALIVEGKQIDNLFRVALEESQAKHLPVNAIGQDFRVFGIFFTIGFAGEFATKRGITGWPAGESLETAVAEFTRWLQRKGGAGNQEEKKQLELLRCFFQKHQHSKFLSINEYDDVTDSKIVNESIGYKKETSMGTIFYAYPERFREAIKREIPANVDDLLKMAADLNILERKDKNHLTKIVRFKTKVTRMLVFNSRVLADDDFLEEPPK